MASTLLRIWDGRRIRPQSAQICGPPLWQTDAAPGRQHRDNDVLRDDDDVISQQLARTFNDCLRHAPNLPPKQLSKPPTARWVWTRRGAHFARPLPSHQVAYFTIDWHTATFHASDMLTRSFARYEFVTYLLTYVQNQCRIQMGMRDASGPRNTTRG